MTVYERIVVPTVLCGYEMWVLNVRLRKINILEIKWYTKITSVR